MMLQNKKLLLPKKIMASKNVLKNKHKDGLAQGIFAKYSVIRNDLAGWFELFFRVDSTNDDYNRANSEQLLSNVRMQLQLQEESGIGGLSNLGHQALINIYKHLDNTVKTLYSSAGYQSSKYINERLSKTAITSSVNNRNNFYIKSNLQQNSLPLNTVAGMSQLENALNFPANINKNSYSSSQLNLKEAKSYSPQFKANWYGLVRNALSYVTQFNTNWYVSKRDVLSYITQLKTYGYASGKTFRDNLSYSRLFKANGYSNAIQNIYFNRIKSSLAYQGDLQNKIKSLFAIQEVLKNTLHLSLHTVLGLSYLNNTPNYSTKVALDEYSSVERNLRNDLSYVTQLKTNRYSSPGNYSDALSYATQFKTNGYSLERILRYGLSYSTLYKVNENSNVIRDFYFNRIKTLPSYSGLLQDSIKSSFVIQNILRKTLPLKLRTITTEIDLMNAVNYRTATGDVNHVLKKTLNTPSTFKLSRYSNQIQDINLHKIKSSLAVKLENRIIQRALKSDFYINILKSSFNSNGNLDNRLNSSFAFKRDLENSLNFSSVIRNLDLNNYLRFASKNKINGFSETIQNIYLKSMKSLYGIQDILIEDSYNNEYLLSPYSFKNNYRNYFTSLPSVMEAIFKKASIKSESINDFSFVIHDKISSGLRYELPNVIRFFNSLKKSNTNRLDRKQKREMNSETKEFWHNMTYNIIQGFRKELESKTNYFFINQMNRDYVPSPFLESEYEGEESTKDDWALQDTLTYNSITHNRKSSTDNFREQQKRGLAPQSIYDLRRTYPDIYNMFTFAGLLPSLYVQKHYRETAMNFLSSSVHQYYIGNRNLTVRNYDLLRKKLDNEKKSFTWPEAMNNMATMEFNNVKKAQKNTSYVSEIQQLKTQVINIEKQTLKSTQSTNININGLVDKVYKEIEQRIKLDRVRRGY